MLALEICWSVCGKSTQTVELNDNSDKQFLNGFVYTSTCCDWLPVFTPGAEMLLDDMHIRSAP